MLLTNTKTGFSVKDILDLPDTNDEDGSAAEGGEEESEAAGPGRGAGSKSPEPSADESPDNEKEAAGGGDAGKKRKRRAGARFPAAAVPVSPEAGAPGQPDRLTPTQERYGSDSSPLPAAGGRAGPGAGRQSPATRSKLRTWRPPPSRRGTPASLSAYSAQSLQHMQYNAQYSAAGSPQYPTAHHLVQAQQWTLVTRAVSGGTHPAPHAPTQQERRKK
uniref:NK2 homeobox 2 n=1 Tax=Coturnix japonica TaxID=93934 RepID=A0A8C2YDX9_COTJA